MTKAQLEKENQELKARIDQLVQIVAQLTTQLGQATQFRFWPANPLISPQPPAIPNPIEGPWKFPGGDVWVTCDWEQVPQATSKAIEEPQVVF